jgi:hypothetical protein
VGLGTDWTRCSSFSWAWTCSCGRPTLLTADRAALIGAYDLAENERSEGGGDPGPPVREAQARRGYRKAQEAGAGQRNFPKCSGGSWELLSQLINDRCQGASSRGIDLTQPEEVDQGCQGG